MDQDLTGMYVGTLPGHVCMYMDVHHSVCVCVCVCVNVL